MAYEVTATRRRPQKFEDLIGQEFVAATLKNSIQSGKIAHAYLFSGPRGCGKTSTARIFAKALNCEKGPTPCPCGECSACKEITKGSSLDVIEIDGASNTSVNDVRQIKDEVQFPPNSSRYKIYIIDEVHMLSTSAFNALLKTIEEPPEYIIFIFATTELQKVPATIKSRCQQFNFRLVPIEKIKEQLALAAAEINIQADDEALYWIAREATGSMRDSYTLFDQVAAFSESHITYEKIRDKLGLVGTDRLNALFEECASANPSGAEEKLNDFLQAGISIEQLITNSADYLRSLLLIKNGIAKESLLGQDPARFSKNVLDAWNSTQIERALSIFLQLYRDIRYSLSPRYEIDLAFSRLCWLKEYVSPSEVKVAVDQARSLLAGAPVQASPASGGSFGTNPPGGNPPGFNYGAENGQSGAPKEFHFAPLVSARKTEAPSFSGQGDFQEETQNFEPPVEQDDSPKAMPSNLQEAKEELAAAIGLKDDDGALASLVKYTDDWSFDGQKISARISDAFQKSRIDEKLGTIQNRALALWGKRILFEFYVPVEEKSHDAPVETPKEVDLLVKVFKGEIVGGKV
ncbi:MAG: DNA polymerase III subunit gamma/tau [Treponema sp.]|nr:DNA polymerase III subunit gamma/tau [Treponema sp.]